MAVKKTSNGTKVEKLVVRKPVVEYLLSSCGMYLYSVIFSVFGIIFIMDQIPGFVKILLGVVFAAPAVIVEFQKGKIAGEKEYKLKNKSILSDIHAKSSIRINPFKSVLYVIPFVASALLFTVLSVALKQQWMQGLMLLIFLPLTLIFMGAGILKLEMGFVSWFSLLSVGISVLIVSAGFIAGFVYSVNSLNNRAIEIVNEIRNYE